jgi:hypothetical protein
LLDTIKGGEKMKSETKQRSVEEIERERDETQEELDNLLREQGQLEERRHTALDDGSRTEGAMSGKPLGARSEMRKVLDRLAELLSLQYVLRKKLLCLQIELAERQLEEKKKERVEALAQVEEALAAKWEAEQKFNEAGNISYGVHNERDDLRRVLNGLRQQLATLERNKAEIGGSHHG